MSLDGTECNKVGTSFSAFRNQPNQCGVPQGACLANQLRDLHQADRARVAAGQAPQYLAAQYGVGSIRAALPGAPQPGSRRLAFPVTQLRNTVVQLTLSADSVRFVVNVAPGYIAAARLVDFSGRNASSFAALSGNGRVLVSIANNGSLTAGFTVSVGDCSPGVSVFQSQGEITVPAGATADQTLACAVEDDRAGRRACVVTLRGAPPENAPPRHTPPATRHHHPPSRLTFPTARRRPVPGHRQTGPCVLHQRDGLRRHPRAQPQRQRAGRRERALLPCHARPSLTAASANGEN